MDFVRNLKGERWWIHGFHRDGKTLERESREGENWRRMGEGVKTPNFNRTMGPWAPNHLKPSFC